MNLKSLCTKIEYLLLQGDIYTEVSGIVHDSGKVSAGDIFVCINGSLTDGHSYIHEALIRGASSVVLENDSYIEQIPANIAVLKVRSSRYALALMSAHFFAYPAQKLITIGLTGTKGKTTTACMIKAILEAAGHKTGFIGTTGAIIGTETTPCENTTPDSYEIHRSLAQMVDCDCEYAIIEVSSQGLKLDRTAGIIFDYGIFTNISPDHISPFEHSSMEEYIKCKGLLFRQCQTGILNADDTHVRQILAGHTCGLKMFSADRTAFKCTCTDHIDLMSTNTTYINEDGRLGVSFDVNGCIQCSVKVYMPGRFSVYNALSAMMCCYLLNIDEEHILNGLEKVQVKGRAEIFPVAGDYTIIIDFAHNDISTRSILETLLEYKPQRLICLYGCGGNRSRQRRYDMGNVTGELADLCVLTCDNPRNESIRNINNDIKRGLACSNGSYIEIDDREKAIAYCIDNAQPGDMIVLLGKGHENYQEINSFKYHFDEREAIAAALSNCQNQL